MLKKQLDQTIEPISESPVINHEISLDLTTNPATNNGQGEQIFGRLLPLQIAANPNQPQLAGVQSSEQIVGYFETTNVPAPVLISGNVEECCDECYEFCCYDCCEIM